MRLWIDLTMRLALAAHSINFIAAFGLSSSRKVSPHPAKRIQNSRRQPLNSPRARAGMRRVQTIRTATETTSAVLLVKVNTNDQNTTVADKAYSDAFFAADTYSVASQIRACSADRAAHVVPYDTENIVVTVQVAGNSSSYTRQTLFLDAEAVVRSDILSLSEGTDLRSVGVDRIVFCVPPGLSGPSFYASGRYGKYWSMANSTTDACVNAAVMMHELGHNDGLKHARQDGIVYADESSIMGQTYLASTLQGRYRCYNGQNLWKLGWFKNEAYEMETIDSSTAASMVVELAAFVDAAKIQPAQIVVLKVLDLFLVYNRQKDYNQDTGDFPDMVTIAKELENGDSDLLGGLDDSEGSNLFTYHSDMTQPIQIQVCSRLQGENSRADAFTVAVGISLNPCSERLFERPLALVPSSAPTKAVDDSSLSPMRQASLLPTPMTTPVLVADSFTALPTSVLVEPIVISSTSEVLGKDDPEILVNPSTALSSAPTTLSPSSFFPTTSSTGIAQPMVDIPSTTALGSFYDEHTSNPQSITAFTIVPVDKFAPLPEPDTVNATSNSNDDGQDWKWVCIASVSILVLGGILFMKRMRSSKKGLHNNVAHQNNIDEDAGFSNNA